MSQVHKQLFHPPPKPTNNLRRITFLIRWLWKIEKDRVGSWRSGKGASKSLTNQSQRDWSCASDNFAKYDKFRAKTLLICTIWTSSVNIYNLHILKALCTMHLSKASLQTWVECLLACLNYNYILYETLTIIALFKISWFSIDWLIWEMRLKVSW